jgi:hypothetical protein
MAEAILPSPPVFCGALRPPDKGAMIPAAPGAAPQAGEVIRELRLGGT